MNRARRTLGVLAPLAGPVVFAIAVEPIPHIVVQFLPLVAIPVLIVMIRDRSDLGPWLGGLARRIRT